MKKFLLILFVFVNSLFASVGEISVSIAPQKYFVQKIVGDKFHINVMVYPGTSPHNYEPKPSQMRDLMNSKIYFSIGVTFEDVWLNRFKQSAKNTIFIDSTNGIEKIAMEEHNHDEDKKKHKDEVKEQNHHDHEGLDPHIWLDPILVKIQAKNIFDAVVKIDSANESFYKTNYENFLKELDVLNSQIEEILKDYKHKAFMVFHPSWGYFAKRYDLEQIAIEVEGKSPKPNELVEIINDAKEHNIKIVFVSPQFSQNSAKTISKNIGANVVAIDPLNEKWDKDLLNTANQIAKSYK